jgi:hypothetical protein
MRPKKPETKGIYLFRQKRGVFGAIKRELRRRSAIEPVISHMKAEDHLGRCYLKGRAGDAANAIISAVGFKFRRVLLIAEASLVPNPDHLPAWFRQTFSAQFALLTDD